MNLDEMNRRIDRLLASVEQQSQRSNRPFSRGIRIYLFTEQEQATLQALLEHIEPRISNDQGLDLSKLTDGELDELEYWLLLEQALALEDIVAAARYRNYLTRSRDELLAAFLAIDEQQIPATFDQTPTYTDRHNIIYHLDRASFRYLKQSVERSQAQGESQKRSTIKGVRMWLETFVPAFC